MFNKLFSEKSNKVLFIFAVLFSFTATYSFGQRTNGFNPSFSSKSSSKLDSPQASPITLAGNIGCADLNADNAQFPAVTTNYGFKINSGFAGTYTFTNSRNGVRELTGGAPADPNNTVTTAVTVFKDGATREVEFSSTRGISAVIVKTDDSVNVFLYNPVTMEGAELYAPLKKPINHIEYCLAAPASVTIIKEVQTPSGMSSISFAFAANGLASTAFSLKDENVAGPDRYTDSNILKFGSENKISVTESNPFGTGFQLNDISCIGGNTSANLAARSVNITALPGDSVVCTFKNGLLGITAAGASISGRVTTANNRGISRAVVNVLDINTLETRTVRTNSFGYFIVEDVPVGAFYMVTVQHKAFAFLNNYQGVNLSEDLTSLRFVGHSYSETSNDNTRGRDF